MKKNIKYTLIASLAVIITMTVMFKKSRVALLNTEIKPVASQSITPSTLVMPRASNEVYKNNIPVVKKDIPSNPYLTKDSISALPPTMKEFLLLDMKSIKSTDETKRFYDLLRSNTAIDDAQKILLTIKVENVQESEREHLTATRFLARALSDLNNKSNNGLNEVVKKIILKDNLSGPLPEKAKLVFAGDKAELVHSLIAFNQNAHLELLKRTKDANIKKIVENAYNYNESMRLSNQ